jgi:heme/copper-type cytochrome/quinol oxidase subunit 2
MSQGSKIYLATFLALMGWTAMVAAQATPASAPRVIEVLADKDSRFKMAGQSHPEITVKAGEALILRIEARRGKTWNRDGSIHGFTLLHAKDHAKVPGWNLELHSGKQEFTLTAPSQPGEYEVLCTVICSDDHDGMRMKFVVVP